MARSCLFERRASKEYNGSYAILLDAKDLINVVEHSNPVKLQSSTAGSRNRRRPVYSLVNIRGLAAPLALGSWFPPQVKDYWTG